MSDPITRLVNAAKDQALDPWLYESAAKQRAELVATIARGHSLIARALALVSHGRVTQEEAQTWMSEAAKAVQDAGGTA